MRTLLSMLLLPAMTITAALGGLTQQACWAGPAAPAFVADGIVHLAKKKDSVDVTIGGRLFTVYNFGKDLPKPFFSPVYGLADGSLAGRKVVVTKDDAELKVRSDVIGTVKSGEILQGSVVEGDWLWIPDKKAYINKADVEPVAPVLTRPIVPGEKEHKHHKGIWVSVDEVNGIKFWAEDGKIQNAGVDLVTAEGNPAVMRVTNHWLGEDGQPVVTEKTTISIYANGLFAYDITFHAGDEVVEFGDTKEGVFGIRMAHTLREDQGGHAVSSDGVEGTKESWGRVRDWIDYYGEVDGQTYGLALFDNPLNFRRSRYHVRNYGLFTLSPFGQKAYTGGKQPAEHVVLPPGGTLRLRYGLYVHPGDTAAGNVAQEYINYLKLSNPW